VTSETPKKASKWTSMKNMFSASSSMSKADKYPPARPQVVAVDPPPPPIVKVVVPPQAQPAPPPPTPTPPPSPPPATQAVPSTPPAPQIIPVTPFMNVFTLAQPPPPSTPYPASPSLGSTPVTAPPPPSPPVIVPSTPSPAVATPLLEQELTVPTISSDIVPPEIHNPSVASPIGPEQDNTPTAATTPQYPDAGKRTIPVARLSSLNVQRNDFNSIVSAASAQARDQNQPSAALRSQSRPVPPQPLTAAQQPLSASRNAHFMIPRKNVDQAPKLWIHPSLSRNVPQADVTPTIRPGSDRGAQLSPHGAPPAQSPPWQHRSSVTGGVRAAPGGHMKLSPAPAVASNLPKVSPGGRGRNQYYDIL
jgi:hypothetical protein